MQMRGVVHSVYTYRGFDVGFKGNTSVGLVIAPPFRRRVGRPSKPCSHYR